MPSSLAIFSAVLMLQFYFQCLKKSDDILRPKTVRSYTSAVANSRIRRFLLPPKIHRKKAIDCASDSFATLALYKFIYLLTYLLKIR